MILSENPRIEFINGDCMEYMAGIKDKSFDLAIVDPPYGSANNKDWNSNPRGRFGGRFGKYEIEKTGGIWSNKYQKDDNIKHWDIAPDNEYFNKLFEISKNQIIWGGNYFELPPSNNFIIWHKLTISESFSMAMCEYAWTKIKGNAKIFELQPQDSTRFHPTQKPVKLYEWLLVNYAKKGNAVLDTHGGSFSSAIACYNQGFDFVGIELDKNYFNQAVERFKRHLLQPKLFNLALHENKQMKLQI